MSLEKEARIRKGYEFKKAFDEGSSFSDELFKAYVVSSEKAEPRLGILTSRRVGGAVQRNRIRRLFREAFRSLRAEIKKNVDIVILPRVRAREAQLKELARRLEIAFRKLKIMD